MAGEGMGWNKLTLRALILSGVGSLRALRLLVWLGVVCNPWEHSRATCVLPWRVATTVWVRCAVISAPLRVSLGGRSTY